MRRRFVYPPLTGSLCVLAAVMAAACAREPVQVAGPPLPTAPPPAPSVDASPTAIEVQRGETLFSLAKRHGVPMRAIIDYNNLQPPFHLRAGQRLSLPASRLHIVAAGETLYGISRLHGVDSFGLVQLNGIAPPFALTVGQRLRLPTVTSPSGAIARVPQPGEPDNAQAPPSPLTPAGTSILPGPSLAPSPTMPETVRFAWPLRGRILSSFGPKPGGLHNDGVNIAAEAGSIVRAAEAGTVVYAGNELKGYGNLVLVRHDGGWLTAYAHNQEIMVKRGDRLQKGQIIARAGRTGSVESPQLHFEIRRGTQAVDPLPLLGA